MAAVRIDRVAGWERSPVSENCLIIFIDSTRFRELPIKIGTKLDEFEVNIDKFSNNW